MKQYQDMLRYIIENGQHKSDRTGTGTTSVFGYQNRYNLQEGFPLQTTKRVFWRGVVEELLWMLRGETNVQSLQEAGVSIWDEWSDDKGELGPVYGKQWRSWRGTAFQDWGDPEDPKIAYNEVDQIARLIDGLKFNPDSRRHIVTAWNPAEIDDMALPPCHMMFQFNTREMTDSQRISSSGIVEQECMSKGILDDIGAPTHFLDCKLYQRSCDAFLGNPFNIASYSLLTHMIAQCVNMVPGEFIHTFGDLHIYDNHRDQVDEVLSRTPSKLPRIKLDPMITSIDEFRFEHITLEGYEPQGKIPAPVAV